MNIQPIVIATAILAIFQALGLFIIEEILKKKIEFEFKKREQAALIAELFSEWISNPTETKKLNQLTWEATLWLPDDLAKEVNKRLSNSPDAKNIKQIIVDVKKIIHGKPSSMDPELIVHFPDKEKS